MRIVLYFCKNYRKAHTTGNRKGIPVVKKKYNESEEDYLETILLLSHSLPVVRAVDIATEMDFKKSSVSVAMKNLREKGHITVTGSGYIYLTETGRAIAEKIYERHHVLTQYLISLGVSNKLAEEDACKMEHIISEESFRALKEEWEKRK